MNTVKVTDIAGAVVESNIDFARPEVSCARLVSRLRRAQSVELPEISPAMTSRLSFVQLENSTAMYSDSVDSNYSTPMTSLIINAK
ncbi:hypothetical protein K6Y76_08185 [Burkholderia cenocepacia]|jgi:hypothetical protein|uniref:hypothetical protein n=1 Tax=Burkholderia cenocepacia TaxID=95486 RepID=UPI0011982250|nr:hypothetical protein [Burkholderia cenocepacia]MBR8133989.1 hypothetical protein [Burkholderia cenocepacia]MCG0576436.1 hypothetical protein [Burkholderia cenocepacia]MCW3522548.1 hypothetical protein [Burkholderia cenocepacia]MCW3612990.1 hypothetical protein [Burkholderia cenocepacia]MCW3651101.1 hypothetical protein [Burkholderia cenocepacia]